MRFSNLHMITLAAIFLITMHPSKIFFMIVTSYREYAHGFSNSLLLRNVFLNATLAPNASLIIPNADVL